MGKGDRKTKRGKRIMGSHGRVRPKKKNSGAPAEAKKQEKADKS